MTVGRILGMLILPSSAPALAQQVIGEPRLLDRIEDPTPWRVVTSNQVSSALRLAAAAAGQALCLAYDFKGVSATHRIHSAHAVQSSENYRFRFANLAATCPHTPIT